MAFASISSTFIWMVILSQAPTQAEATLPTSYFSFSRQDTWLPSDYHPPKTNWATLHNGTVGVLPAARFTICSSIFIEYFRCHQAFYLVYRNDKLWFTVFLDTQDLVTQKYDAYFYYRNGEIFSNNTGLSLRPHSWSHACTNFDGDTGHVTTVINGVVTHDVTIKSILRNKTIIFEKNLIIGLVGHSNSDYQSEATTGNLNIFTVPKTVSELVSLTTTGKCTTGDHLSWTEAVWNFTGNVETLTSPDLCKNQQIPNLFYFGLLPTFDSCKNLCPRIQAGGRVPYTGSQSQAEALLQQFQAISTDNSNSSKISSDFIYSPFVLDSKDKFVDFYTQTAVPRDLPWLPGEPNGGRSEPCSSWAINGGKLFDAQCAFSPSNCMCKFESTPILKLRGLCKNTNVDTSYTVKNVNGNIVYFGVAGTRIEFSGQWMISVNMLNTSALTSADEESFVLGRHSWIFTDESVKCKEQSPHTRGLKMTRCSEGEFTCGNGDCIVMEERCDQVADCTDESDEVDCSVLVTKKNYNKKVPPFTIARTNGRSIVPVQLNVSIDLLKIVDMEETNHKIDFQFKITLEWRENERVLYYNLKEHTSLNALSDSDIKKLWLPLVIYDNTDQKEVSRLGEYGNGEWNTPVSVIREGSFTRSGIEVLDETEIFEGGGNTLSMEQVYTWQFQCKYNLQYYPFDTQVKEKQV